MRVPHASLDPEKFKTRLRALRAVALFELTKGAVVLLLGFGVVSLVHKDAWDVAENLLHALHVSPRQRYAQVFLNLADNVTDAKLWAVAAGAAAYSTVRFLEGYGLWMARPWAEWLALFAGAIYLPFEVYQLARRPTWAHVVILTVNLAIVLYMLFLRLSDRKHEAEQ
ncbi:MAG TPA: DUF2127 domain-containing protein [Verrucomicrobiae bacterium]|nr:DUF2127 domain-containing protein [Verrucomicrobiae bacterium]